MAKLKKYQIEGMSTKLADAMQKKNLSDRQLANLIGRNRKTIAAWRNADTVPTATDLAKMCAILGISADYLLGLERK